MIQSFADKETEKIWRTERSQKFSKVARIALRRLIQLNAAESLNDLRVPPGYRLEALVGDRKGQHSIRINQRFRICFAWTSSGPKNVEIVDYH
ncbi:MAG TPA: plasmid maintenance system killer [Opitutae bacterium]|nr:plasmid maintenance system killer [Opitutaceae bacterium]HCR31500.1 plasmid maintenance system killer [Opitutae bacterium]|tara:strand:+ start:93 stop:371 length:279 start_codon:yes stop_codon:yes gene_type:complete